MYHIIYKISHYPSGEYYIGKHTTDNINDSYMGSGLRINRKIKKYPIEEFSKTVLMYCNTSEDAFICESEILAYYIHDVKCLNLTKGGEGFRSRYKHNWQGRQHTAETKAKMSAKLIGNKRSVGKRKPHTEEFKQRKSILEKQRWASMSKEEREKFKLKKKEEAKNLLPWNKSNAKIQVWSNARNIYDIWIGNNKPKKYVLCKIVEGNADLENSYASIVKRFIEGWNPYEDEKYNNKFPIV